MLDPFHIEHVEGAARVTCRRPDGRIADSYGIVHPNAKLSSNRSMSICGHGRDPLIPARLCRVSIDDRLIDPVDNTPLRSGPAQPRPYRRDRSAQVPALEPDTIQISNPNAPSRTLSENASAATLEALWSRDGRGVIAPHVDGGCSRRSIHAAACRPKISAASSFPVTILIPQSIAFRGD